MKKTKALSDLFFLLPTAKQKQAWDELVLNQKGAVYQLSWYLDAVCGENNWGIITNSELNTGLVTAFKKRLGYKNIYQPFFTMYFEVVNPIAAADHYINVVEKDFHHIHFTCLQPSQQYTCIQRVRQEMSITNFDARKKYSENAIRQIKKAEKASLKFSTNTTPRQVVNLFKHNKGKELKEYKPKHFKVLEQLIETCQQHKAGFCVHVEKDSTVLAAGFFILHENRVIFLKGGVSPEGKKNGAMYYLMHMVIQNATETYTLFDFGGSNNQQVAAFYHKLGGLDTTYFEIELDQRTVLQKALKKVL